MFGDLKIMQFAILHQKVILNKSNFRFKYLKFVKKKKKLFPENFNIFLSLMSMVPSSVSINAAFSKILYQVEYPYGDNGDTVIAIILTKEFTGAKFLTCTNTGNLHFVKLPIQSRFIME